jgi:hypothetical protein
MPIPSVDPGDCSATAGMTEITCLIHQNLIPG